MSNKNRYGNYYSQAIKNDDAPSAEEVKPVEAVEEVVAETPVEEPVAASNKVQKSGKITAIFPYGCLVIDEEDGQSLMVYGKYADKSVGDVITFDYEE